MWSRSGGARLGSTHGGGPGPALESRAGRPGRTRTLSPIGPSLRAGAGGAGEVASDEELLLRTAAGDRDALRILFHRYAPRVRSFAARRLADPVAAEDLTADTFLEVWRSAGRFGGRSRVSTWIFGIAHFKCMAASRARRRSKRSRVIPSESELLEAVPGGLDPSEVCAARRALRRVARALERLPLRQREAFELAVVQGRPYAEVARSLGVEENTVKTRVARARGALRREFGRAPAGPA